MEFAMLMAMGMLVTLLATVYSLPLVILIPSYLMCFLAGYVIGQWHRRHES